MRYSSKGKITRKVELTGKDILSMMGESHILTPYAPPADADIEFKVPSGGDYSGCSVDFKDEARVVVTWVVEANEEEDDAS